MFSTGVFAGSREIPRNSAIPLRTEARFAFSVSPCPPPLRPSFSRSSSPPTFSSLWRSFFRRAVRRGVGCCRGQAGFDLLPEDGILEVLRGFPVEEVRRLVGRRRGGKIDEPRLRAGEREDPLLPRGQGADPRGEVVLLVPADQPPHRLEQVPGALLPAAGRLVGQLLPQPGNFPLEDARQPLPSPRPDPLRVGRGDLGEENPFGLGARPG